MRGPLAFIAILAATGAIAAPALGGDADVQGVWEIFAKNCAAIVEADDPVRYAGTQLGQSPAAGATADGSIAVGTILFEERPEGIDTMLLQTAVNRFEDGRTVQCMLQLFRPGPEWAGLAGIARDRVAAAFPNVPAITGGPMVPTIVPKDVSKGPELKNVMSLRFASEGFPPRAVVTVQIVPNAITLIYRVDQPGKK